MITLEPCIFLEFVFRWHIVLWCGSLGHLPLESQGTYTQKKHATKKIRVMKNDQIDSLWTTLRAEVTKISIFTQAFIYRQASIFDGSKKKAPLKFLVKNIHYR